VHTPVRKGDCLGCHEPTDKQNHTFGLRADSQGELCLRCHESAYKRYVASRPHPPVRDKLCTACHAVHNSEYRELLVEFLSPERYVPYDDGDSFALCFQCHDIELLDEEETDEYTDFRNGEKNLHYLHVNRESKGRNCRICHLPHGGAQPRLIRPTVPFGPWELRIRFAPTPSGGYCGPACHPAKRYDRENPIDWNREPTPPSMSATQP